MSTKKTKNEIIIYTNETCPYCKQIKEKLDEEKISYTNRLTTDYEEQWNEIGNLIGMSTVPTIHYKGSYFVAGRDFPNPDFLLNIIKNYKQSKFSIEEQTIEKIKTLNHNIYKAFQGVDSRLQAIEKNYRELFEEETKTK
jgi:glutaredoxin